MKHTVKTLENKKVADIELHEGIFALEPRADILHRVVNWQLARRQSGNHQTKTISMVQGSTRKPFRQKGTGRARQGSIRMPQHRGGAVIFGPVTRSHAHDLNKKVRKLGLRMALSSKVKDGSLHVVDKLALEAPKTKILKEILSKNSWNKPLFIDVDQPEISFAKALGNIIGADYLPQIGANVYSILQHDQVVITKDALECLEGRLK